MESSKNQEKKNLITDIAVKKLDISRLQKELTKLESESREELARRYEA